ncbi:MAG TPA: hypothetical protein VKM72_01050 [Thermoanaerobaculia bacterium]|nr:hypothetical protein [Thermoanaerobaculia bacterium]
MKRVGLSRFRLGPGARPEVPATPLRPSLLEPQGFRVRKTDPAPLPPPPKTASVPEETR